MKNMKDIVINIENLRKQYRLGSINGGTLTADLQSWWARIRGKDDPNSKIGSNKYSRNDSFWALDDINLTVYKGETLGVIGGNGAGKSTMLKILSRVTAPTEGKIFINGRISSMLEVGTGFNKELTGRENIYMNGSILGMSKTEVDSKIDNIIEFSECSQFIDTPVKRYSSGMYVKLAFAVAAHLDSDILVMDEVLAVGDMKFQSKCLGKMSDVADREGRTVLYVSHNMNTIRQLCSRCIVLDKGRIVFDGNVEQAIEIYIGNSISNKLIYDIGDNGQPAGNGSLKIKLKTIEILNKENNLFYRGEPLIFRITYFSDYLSPDYDNLYFRFILYTMENHGVGMGISPNITNNKENGLNHAIFSFDTSDLAPGQYYFNIVAFSVNKHGVNERHDLAEQSFQIAIERNNGDFLNLNWSNKWGNVYFDSVKVLE